MMRRVRLKGRGDFDEWRDAARALRLADVAPQAVDWCLEGESDLFGAAEEASLPASASVCDAPAAVQQASFSVPADFVRLAQAVLCHSDPARFALLYRILFRLRQERDLLAIPADPDMVAARAMSKSVGRDYHKMTAFVRFKEVPLPQRLAGRRRFIAWFEPEHFIVSRVAPFFQRRFTDMDWLIATPRGAASWDGARLAVSDAPATKPDLADATDDLWRVYYASIFNPARLKVKMMMTEMPKKYWKNLPEADIIPGLIAQAESRVLDMAARQASEPLAFHHRIQKASQEARMPDAAPAGTLAALRQQANTCDRCSLHCQATQTVFGEGPERADLMVVGEQPGDEEDLAGRPFVGPAGRLFSEVLSEVGLDRRALYITNAVKHFKYEPRGKRRIHQRPDRGEVQQCRWWLTQEIELVRPKLIVAMGATALFALTEMSEKLSEIRGRPMAMAGGRLLFPTVHPSFLLRIPDRDRQAAERAQFRQDLSRVKDLAASLKEMNPPADASVQEG